MRLYSNEPKKQDKVQVLLRTLESMLNVDNSHEAISQCLSRFIDPIPARELEVPLPPVGHYNWRLKFHKFQGDRGYYILHSPAVLRYTHCPLLKKWVGMLPKEVQDEAKKLVKDIFEPLKTLLLFHIAYNLHLKKAGGD